MPRFRGTVDCVSVSDLGGFTALVDAGGDREIFILWFNPGPPSGIPPQLDGFTRILHSMWVSLLRQAHANGLTVEITHAPNGSIVDTVQLG